MAEQIISASGEQYGLVIDSQGRAQVNASVSAGSESYLYGKSGADYYPLLSTSGTDGGILRTDVSVTTGSESYIKGGSLIAMGQSGGTSYPLLTDTEGILQTSASVTTGSESYNYVDSGGTFVLEPFKREISISGTPAVSSSISNFDALGSSVVVENFGDLGSSRIVTNVIGVTPSGTFNVAVSTDPVPISGTVAISQTGTENNIDIANSNGTLSTNNSTTTPLGIDAVFTGTADDIKDYSAVNVAIFADQDSATDGLSMEWSQDGTNWDEKMTVSIGASKVESYEFGVRARYFRIVYTNGGTEQGAFRLQVILHPTRTRVGARCLCVDIDSREFATTGRAVLAAKKPDGDYTNIHATTGGNLKISIEEFDDSAKLPSGTNFIGYTGVTPSGTFSVDVGNTGSMAITNFDALGSSVVVENFGDLGSSRVVTNVVGVTPSGTFSVDTNLYAGSEAYIPAGSVIVTNKVAGSIVNMPTVDVSATNLDIRDLTSASDSIEVIGSVNIDNAADVGGYAGSDIYNKVKSGTGWIDEQQYKDVVISGTPTVSSSISNFGTLGSSVVVTNFGDLGSTVVVDSPSSIGSYATQTVDGTVSVTDIATAGSLSTQTVDATNLDIRDLSSASDSVTATINSPASIGSYTTQTVDGTVSVNGIATAGSLSTQTVDGTVSANINSPASIGSLSTQTVDGTVSVTGIATAGSLAVQNIAGSVYNTGSVNIVNDLTLEDVGSPCFKQATATASGTYTQVWGIGGTGSKIEIHGWKLSTQLPGYVRVLRSGGTPAVIADYYMAYASGAVIEKTFVTPIIPGGADIHVGVGTTVAGSTSLTIYGREVK